MKGEKYAECTVCHEVKWTHSSWKSLMNGIWMLLHGVKWGGVVPPYAPKGPFCWNCVAYVEMAFVEGYLWRIYLCG